ncbi:MAG TPA: HesA/MoeB/ThiF family protein [Sphingobacteriaceae bacterium]
MEYDVHSERYQRQVMLKELGESGQQKLRSAKVFVAGAGGLGCPALQYLAAAGVGTIGIIDHDIVSLSNLHRQVLFTTADVGVPKVSAAAVRLADMNPGIEIITYAYRLTTQNALEIMECFDVIVDATDNFPTRYLIGDACVLLGKPLVQGAVSRYEGQLAVFNCQTDPAKRPVCYRDLFPEPPEAGEIANCAEAGVLGVLPGIIGTMQAAEVIKLVTGTGTSLAGKLQTFDMLRNEWFTWDIQPNLRAERFIPQTRSAFLDTVYETDCALSDFTEVDPAAFEGLRRERNVTVIDVRERDELPPVDGFPHLQIPLSELKRNLDSVKDPIIITVCQSGKRSSEAARLLAEAFREKTIYSLRGGIAAWKQQHSTQ